MLILIDIFSINRILGYANPILDILVIELCSTGGCPLEEAPEHCFHIQSFISLVILISFHCYCGDCSGYLVVIFPFLAFYFCAAYILYPVYSIFSELKIEFTCALMHLLNTLLAELSKYSSTQFFVLLSTESSSRVLSNSEVLFP
jgi:hypothetical protein